MEHIAVQTRRGLKFKEHLVRRSPELRSLSLSPSKKRQYEASFMNDGMDDGDMLPRMESPLKRQRHHRARESHKTHESS